MNKLLFILQCFLKDLEEGNGIHKENTRSQLYG